MGKSKLFGDPLLRRGILTAGGVVIPDPDFIFDPATLETDFGNFDQGEPINGTVTGFRNTGARSEDLDFLNSAGNAVNWIENVNSSGLPGLTYVNAVGPSQTGSRFFWDGLNPVECDILKLNNGANGGTASEDITIMFPFCALTGLLSTTDGGILMGARDAAPTPDQGWWLSINGTGGTPPAQNNVRLVYMDPAGFKWVDPNRTWTVDVWEIVTMRMKKLAANSWLIHCGLSELLADQANATTDFEAVQAAEGGGANANNFNISGDGDFGGRSSFQQGRVKIWASALDEAVHDAALIEMAANYGVTIP